jgi:GNAT superfamily N-acetyltransferase
VELREIREGETALAARTLLELRPAFGTPEALTVQADGQRAAGYRLAGAFVDGTQDAAAVAGFRIAESLAWGRALYVDDLVTHPDHRGAGLATALLAWLDAEARRAGCRELHLDSGVVPERQAAHRRYFGHGMRIAAYHFTKALQQL